MTATAVIVGACAVAACSSAPGSKPSAHVPHNPARAGISAGALYQSPEQATLSWFYALNHKDMAAAVAHFEPVSAYMMSDGYRGPSAWPTFSALRCKQISASGNTAAVLCTFNESGGLAGVQQDNFWTIFLHQQSDGRWLLTNYEQG